MDTVKWQSQKVKGRDEVLLDIETCAGAYASTVVLDARSIMQDYEVDMYRLVLAIGRHYGMERAYEIMSETVAEKRLRWLDQALPELHFSGSEVEKGLALYLAYFKPKAGDFEIVSQTVECVTFKRKDFVNAIFHACDVLGLDVIEVNNKVYAQAMNCMFEKLNLDIEHTFIDCRDGWYEEKIEKR